LLQAVVPLICLLPMVAVFITVGGGSGFDKTNKVVFRFGENGILTVLDFGLIVYNFNPTLDALVTLFVAKPYWMSAKQIFSNVKGNLVGGENSVRPI
jgi:hypothetical protein